MEVKRWFCYLVCREGGLLHARLHVPHDQRLLVIWHHNVPFWRDDVNAQVAKMAAGKDMKKGPYGVKTKQGETLVKKWKIPIGATYFAVREKISFNTTKMISETENASQLPHVVFRLIRKTAVFFRETFPVNPWNNCKRDQGKTALWT